MKTLLIDNYDSFTYNLFQLLSEANGEEPIVVRNDELPWAELAGSRDFDNIVISPGPGNPDREADFGVCADAIRNSEVPLLGVCLGHQGLCSAYGAKVVHAPEAMHGRISAVTHEDSGIFAGLPREFQVVRYHSLCVEQPLPPELEGDRLDQRRDSDGGCPPRTAPVGLAVPSGVDLHRARPRHAGPLPRPDDRALRPSRRRLRPLRIRPLAAGGGRRRARAADQAARLGIRHRAGLRPPLR